MGFFDRFTAKKPEPAPQPAPAPAQADAPSPPVPSGAAGGVKPRLAAARERLEAKDLPGALALYEELLAAAGDRADVLVTVSGDLGSHGHVAEVIELVAPRYDALRHGPATGINLLQAYLAVRNPDAAQHVLDILFTLNRPELEERLHGFSNAIADMMVAPHQVAPDAADGAPPPEAPKIAMISISKPIWFYGLEPLAERILPRKDGRLRRIAFGQLAVLGLEDPAEAMKQPEDELGRLARAVPLWLAETFAFSTGYAAIAAVGLMQRPDGPSHHVIFGAEWTTENLRQLVDSTEGGLDYVFTGAIRQQAGDYELVLRVWEVKKFRERKMFQTRWTPSTANAELAKLHEQVRLFMEWSVAGGEFTYAPAAAPRAWLEVLGAALPLFLVEKSMLPADQLAPLADDLDHAARGAATAEAASLAWLTLRARAERLAPGTAPAEVRLFDSPLVAEAARLLA